MARRNDGLTPRQRQSQMIMREKAARKKREALLRKSMIAGGGLLSLSLMAASIWVWKTGALSQAVNGVVTGSYALTAQAGFSLQSLYLEGRNRTPMKDIEEALNVKKGDPLLRLSVSEIRERLESIGSIKMAAVERSLPDRLYVRIVEREPVAQWQSQGKIALVDDQGVVMGDVNAAPYAHLPLIVGKEAPHHVQELLDILSSQPELAKRYVAAVHIGDRRWNVRLNGNGGMVEIRLPEHEPMEAWKTLADMQLRQHVLDRDVKVIDLRLEGRLFIKVAPEENALKPSKARET